jgi:hypothetical protein
VSNQEMSTKRGVNEKSQTFYCLCQRLHSPKAPLSTNIHYQSRGYQYYKLVTKLARRLHGNWRKYAGGEASQFKAEVEALQA